ncbi:MAG: DJ-1/PfpI family protein [Phycisphaeraceae bacterium]|nr:DJ-1/PfpI family protein [Phycisphaeraceae bacterium]
MPNLWIAALVMSSMLTAEPATPAKALFVVAHQDFYYQEYAQPRDVLEKAGVQVVVTADQKVCRPHPNTGQPAGVEGVIQADVLLKDVKPQQYAAVVFVGGWGASMYQPAFTGMYNNPRYKVGLTDKTYVNNIVTELAKESRILAAICHGVTALAWCRVSGPKGLPVSPLAGKKVCGYQGNGPACLVDKKLHADNTLPSRWHVEENGGTQLAPNAVGDPATAADDVMVDGNIITAQNPDSALAFGQALAKAIQSR